MQLQWTFDDDDDDNDNERLEPQGMLKKTMANVFYSYFPLHSLLILLILLLIWFALLFPLIISHA